MTLNVTDCEVDLFDRLPTPRGLIRTGVATDHPEKKRIADTHFQHLIRDERVRFFGNVWVGTDLGHANLAAWYDAVVYAVYAVCAGGDKALGIPGEPLPGCLAVRDFGAFYTGRPDFDRLGIDLSCERAVIVGNGNVALDVARMLALPVETLEKTDISDRPLDLLRYSKIREVVLPARRGAKDAAFHNPELEELEHLTGVDVSTVGDDLAVQSDTVGWHGQDRRRKLATLRRLAARPRRAGNKRIELRFMDSPVEIIGESQSVDSDTGLTAATHSICAPRTLRHDSSTTAIGCG